MLTWRAAFRASHEGLPLYQKKSERTCIVIKTAVARRYAQALFELLDVSTIEPTRVALTGLGQAIKDSVELRHVVASPVLAPKTKLPSLQNSVRVWGVLPSEKPFSNSWSRKIASAFFLKSPRPSRNLPMRRKALSQSPSSPQRPYPQANKIKSAIACAQCSSAKSKSPFTRMPAISPACRSVSAARWSIAPCWGGYKRCRVC